MKTLLASRCTERLAMIDKAEKKRKAIEKLAALEHEQWISWSQSISKTETTSLDRLERWKKLWVPYSQLTEKMKEEDRKWARRLHAIFEEDVKG
ncbi:MAG: hypothetical protein U9N61_00015 [Euryarchaeota archaeon]|nr:hypothetical protein [Euryarchaeota archaeon]